MQKRLNDVTIDDGYLGGGCTHGGFGAEERNQMIKPSVGHPGGVGETQIIYTGKTSCTCGEVTPELDARIKKAYKQDWREIFRLFYDDNENGGSSRWLVAPQTVENFIQSLLMK